MDEMRRFSLIFIEPLLLFLVLVVVLSIGIPIWTQEPQRGSSKSATNENTTVQPAPSNPVYEFPAGGRVVFPAYRLVALYGTPGSKTLGVLGEQDVDASIARVKEIANTYQQFTNEKIYPCFEVIATIASAGATHDGNYSRELDVSALRPWVDSAKAAGVYVILDLQPGRTDFLTQAKQFEQLLKEPHVGLALDPEWRLQPNQVHLKQIGSVDADEVNQTATYLADVVKQNNLPQKVFLLHQFKRSMLGRRELIDTSRSELAYVIQMDGQGAQSTKQDTWRIIREGALPSFYFGWKNFYDEDKPMLTPEQTMQVQPAPWYISYQ